MADAAARLVRRGVCHVFGDDVALDEAIIPARLAAQRVTDPAVLTPHLFESIDPTFAQRVRRGDIILAGRNFACGKPRVQGLIAMEALGLSVVCVAMPYKILRRAVARALPVLVGAPEPCALALSGDELEIDFSTGVFRNLTRGGEVRIPAMPPILHDIVASGGAEGALRAWLARHPEQAKEAI